MENARKAIFEPREAFRSVFLEAERKRLEELANSEAQLLVQKSDSRKKGSAGKGKKKK